jgi:DNA invertase Pin-like site-specific DNA recombinase
MHTSELTGQRIAIYVRYSSENQRDTSADDQIDRLTAWTRLHGGTSDRTRILDDRAMSGTGSDRPAFRELLRLVDSPRKIDVIVVEDLSRLSRDEAELHLLQRTLKYEGVRLIGVADGIDTGAAHGELTFGLKAIISATYIRELSDKTRRGLLGAAQRGLSTGGRTFGYRTLRGSGPHGDCQPVICDSEAILVRRIFELYRDGYSLKGIAGILNAENVPPPRASHPNRKTRGWVHTTIRSMLHNETYIGIRSYNEREFRKVPGTNRRRSRRRDKDEWIRGQDATLRIVPQDLWDQVHDRLDRVRANYTRDGDGSAKGRAIPGGSAKYLFSGLLRCGVCGERMVISGGSGVRRYRCIEHMNRGTCKNALSVPEDVLRTRLLQELRHTLARPAGIAYARKCIAERLGELDRQRRKTLEERRKVLAETKRQIACLVRFITDGLATEKEKAASIRAELTALEIAERDAARAVRDAERETVEPVPLPSQDEMLSLVFDLEARLSADTERGREELRRLFKDGQITLLPQPGRYYVARSEVLPLVLVSEPPALSASGSGTDLLVARGRYAGCIPRYRWCLKSSWWRKRRANQFRESATQPARRSLLWTAHESHGLPALA